MKLHSLSLRNFRQHIETDIHFPDGLTGIIGSNGAGKTSLIEAIVFAIYGSKAVRGKVDDLKTRGTRRDAKLSVELVFEHDSNTFRIYRTLEDAELYIGGESRAIAGGNREVTSRVAALLRMEYEEFVATFFTEQKGLEFLSGKKGVTEREKFIVRMMGYDRLEKAQELLRADRRDKRNAVAGWEAGLGDRALIEERIKTETAEVAAMQEKHGEAARVLVKAEKEVHDSGKVLQAVEVRREEYMKVRQLIGDKQARYEEKVARARAAEKERQELLDEQAGLQDWGQTVPPEYLVADGGREGEFRIEDTVEKLRAAVSAAASAVSAGEDELRRASEEWRMKVLAGKAELDLQNSQLAALKKRASDLSVLNHGGDCPTCGQELGASFEKVKDHFAEETAAKEKLVQKLGGDYQALSVEPKEISALKDNLAAAQRHRAGLEEALGRLSAVQSKVLKLERLNQELESVRREMSALNGEIEALRKSLLEIRFSEEDYSKLKSHHDSTSRLMEVARLQRVKLEGELNTREAMLSRSKTELGEYDQKLELLNRSKKELVAFEDSDRVLTEFRRFLNAQLRPRLAELASEFLAELTDGRYTAVDIAADFTPTVLEDGQPKAVISGGEEDLLNLCVRLALSNMLAERAGHAFSLLVLDEVFGSLDEGRRRNVLNLLDRLGNRFEQILVITHLEDVREGVQNLMYVNYDEAGGGLTIEDPLRFEESEMVFNL